MYIERFVVALAIGLLIGLERGWQHRNEPEGSHFAGLRTFGLVGMLGALSSILGEQFGAVVLGAALLSITVLIAVGHLAEVRQDRDVGITTPVAALLTFTLGMGAGAGQLLMASMLAVVTVVLLAMKPVLQSWVEHLNRKELHAVLKMLLISVVLLPVLPDQGYGPWQVLNPREIWWMVVLIAGISFIGYFAIRIAGSGRGLMATGFFGGLASSTAVTLTLSRLASRDPRLIPSLTVGILLASGTMFPRILVEIAVVNADLLAAALWPMLVMMVVMYLPVPLLLYRSRAASSRSSNTTIRNPFEIMPALRFAALLVGVMLLAELARQWFSDTGIQAVAAISGLTDVDAITLSLSRMAREQISGDTALSGIVIAASVNTVVNTVVKAVLAAVFGGIRLALPVLIVSLCAVGAGLTALWWV